MARNTVLAAMAQPDIARTSSPEPNMNPQENTIRIDGSQVLYTVRGKGSPVLLLHGWGSSSDSWRDVQNMLANVGLRVFAIDLPGFGKTPPPSSVWGVEEYASCVEQFARALGLSSFSLVGHSFGGQIAVFFASSHPSLVAKLVLIAPAAIRPPLGTRQRALFLAAKLLGIPLSLIPSATLRAWIRRKAYGAIGRRDYGRSEGIMKDVLERVIRQDLSRLLPAVNIPTLLLWGDNDRLTPLIHGLFMKDALPNASLRVFPGRGHNLHKEVPKDIARDISLFLRP